MFKAILFAATVSAFVSPAFAQAMPGESAPTHLQEVYLCHYDAWTGRLCDLQYVRTVPASWPARIERDAYQPRFVYGGAFIYFGGHHHHGR